jgi:heat shock protein 4
MHLCEPLYHSYCLDILQVNEGFPFSIALSWKPDSQNNEPQQTVVFPKGNPIPSVKALTFYRSNTFAVDVLNVQTDDLQITEKISTYTVHSIINIC